MSGPGDFSYFSLFTAGLACVVPFANAYTQPKGDVPKGNPISAPGLKSIVPVGEPFDVTWKPTTDGTVTLVLLKGPSDNAVPQYAIAENIENNGHFSWTPKDDLEPKDTGYGIELIDDATGQYQYTTQFGISQPDEEHGPPSGWPGHGDHDGHDGWGEHGGHGHDGPDGYFGHDGQDGHDWPTSSTMPTEDAHMTTEVVRSYTTYCPHATTLTMNNLTYTVSTATTLTITDCPCTITKTHEQSSAVTPAPTGSMPHNSTVVQPTRSMTVPSSLHTASATAPSTNNTVSNTGTVPTPTPTNSASSLGASFLGLALAAGVAVFAL